MSKIKKSCKNCIYRKNKRCKKLYLDIEDLNKKENCKYWDDNYKLFN